MAGTVLRAGAVRRVVGDVVHPTAEGIGLDFLAGLRVNYVQSAGCLRIPTTNEQVVMCLVESCSDVFIAFRHGPGGGQFLFLAIDDSELVLVHGLSAGSLISPRRLAFVVSTILNAEASDPAPLTAVVT